MPVFKVIAKSQTGNTVTRTAEAENQLILAEVLRREGLIAISVQEIQGKSATAGFLAPKVKLDDLCLVTRQLATLIEAGIPLLQGLDILAEQVENSTFKKVLKSLQKDVEAGKSFSEALNKQSHVFSPMYISMVKAGEESGKLEVILDRLATYLEKTSALIRKVKSAMIYPAIVSILAFVITLVLLLKVIPVFKGIFDSFGAELPPATAALIALSDFIRNYFLYEIVGVVGTLFLIKRYIRTPIGRKQLDRTKLKMPIFGTIFQKVAVSRFTRTFATLVKSGVPILIALEIVGKSVGNKIIEQTVLDVRGSIREGENIAEPLAKSKVFPPMVVRMIAVGEKSGELEKMLTKVSDFYDEQVDTAVKGLTSLIEPLIIAFLGVMIGGIVIAMFLPIFKLTTLVNA